MFSMGKNPDKPYDPFKDPVLRREAGEGWHPTGLHRGVLRAIVAREIIATEIGDVRDDERNKLIEMYSEQSELVDQLKHQVGIGDPPLPPTE